MSTRQIPISSTISTQCIPDWIVGQRNPQDYIDAQSFTGTYTGPAYGNEISGTTVTPLTSGQTSLDVDFGANEITGDITFAEVAINIEVTSNAITDNTFNSSNVNVNNNGGSGNVNGAFFGDEAQAVGGSFDATASDSTRYIGIFGGTR
ncbi:MAG: transferrin-binding protein-like solute binding protein [Desulfurivibrio sp.]|nr:transferrin-binding protein-like solute binding protein [Desulfurivibrio sp.]